MKKIPASIFFPVIVLSVFLSGCGNAQEDHHFHRFSSYRDIPGVTSQEIAAIEAIRHQILTSGSGYFVYGMQPNIETFINSQGEMRGFSVLFCEWLTELFGIPFVPRHYVWLDLLAGLENGEIAFTGDLTPSEERRKTYLMTGTIAQRSLKYFRLEDSLPISEIAQNRLPRYTIRQGTTVAVDVITHATRPFEPVFIYDYNEAYELLRTGAADALITEGAQEAYWDAYGDVVISDFFPLLYSPVSLTTQTQELSPIISVFQKALENGAFNHLGELYAIGHSEYLRHKLYTRLTPEEREFIRQDPIIRLGAEYDNYPISYHNDRYNQWQGIAFDVLKEVSSLTGLEFTVVHGNATELLQMLETGEVDMVTELIRTPEREGNFLWPNNSFMTDRSVLISRLDYHNVILNRIYSERVGIGKGTAQAEFFHRRFPNHPNVTEYDDQTELFDALIKGDIDLVMNSQSSLLNLINYKELTDFKANVMFNNSFESTFGFNKNRYLLSSIVDKTLEMIETGTITERWRHRTYDYRLRLAHARVPWLIGSIGLSLLVLLLIAILFMESRMAGKKLEELVEKRTYELKEMEGAALAASKSKSSFLANMSHEIRTPMNAILGVTEILIQNKTLPKDIEEGLDKIYSSCSLLLGIINDILDFSKIEAGKMDIIPVHYSVASLVNDSVHLNMMRIESKPIEFELRINENVPAYLIGDELRIKQLLNNLLSNAFKYTDAGKVILSVQTEPLQNEAMLPAGAYQQVLLVLGVQDTGRGMSKEQLGKMFEEYARFDEKANSHVEGTGLGLSITQRLITLMDGKFRVESEPGKGTLFEVRLPQEIVDNEVLGKGVTENLQQFRKNYMKYKKRGQIAREPMPYGSVLVVDDVETNLYVATGLMKLYQLQIDTVMSGKEAINRVQSGKVYDVIFMDHMMPEMDGMEATKRIRKMGYTSPIVALTANAVAGQADVFLNNGFDDFISKPIDIRQMNAVLNKLVRDKQPPEVIEAARQKKNIEVIEESESESGIKLSNKEIAGMDIIKGIVRYDGDEETYIKILRSYTASVSPMLDEIESICAEFPAQLPADKLANYRTKVHGIKGTSLDLFAGQVGNDARDLEEAAKASDFDFIQNNTAAFLETTRKLIAGIEAVLSSIGADSPKPQKDKPDKDVLLELLAACRKSHINKVDEAMAELDKYQYDSDDGLVDWLRECIDRMDFEQIVEKLSDLKI